MHRWAAGELSVIAGLANYDLTDVYRQLHGYPPLDSSWYALNGKGRRFDHIFASKNLGVYECSYIHEWREKKLSDHSPIAASFG